MVASCVREVPRTHSEVTLKLKQLILLPPDDEFGNIRLLGLTGDGAIVGVDYDEIEATIHFFDLDVEDTV